jgi:hypothetical protein
MQPAEALGRCAGAVQTECAAWCRVLPESLRDSTTAAALGAMTELDLDAIARFSRVLAMVVAHRRTWMYG